jgi:hypothetical protein
MRPTRVGRIALMGLGILRADPIRSKDGPHGSVVTELDVMAPGGWVRSRVRCL